jgi:hypothetical protein
LPATFGTGVCQSDVVPRSLPIFKRFVTIITKGANKNDADLVIMQARSCLSSIMRVLEHAKYVSLTPRLSSSTNNDRIRGEAGIPCVRNTLMAATIVVTAGVNILPANEEHLPKLCDQILSSLTDPLTATIAVQCTRSIIMASPKTACDQEMVRYFLPKLVAFVSSPPSADTAAAKSAVAAILTAFARSLVGEQVQVALTLFVPMLLERARVEGAEVVGKETAERLLELAQTDQAAFKAVVANLNPAQKGFMEEVLRSNVGGPQKTQTGNSQPTIALKMNFG